MRRAIHTTTNGICKHHRQPSQHGGLNHNDRSNCHWQVGGIWDVRKDKSRWGNFIKQNYFSHMMSIRRWRARSKMMMMNMMIKPPPPPSVLMNKQSSGRWWWIFTSLMPVVWPFKLKIAYLPAKEEIKEKGCYGNGKKALWKIGQTKPTPNAKKEKS